MHGGRVFGTVDAGNAEANRRGTDVAVADRGIHHVVEHFLDFELARRLEVRAAAACLSDDLTLPVGEQAHRFCAARIDAEHVHVPKL